MTVNRHGLIDLEREEYCAPDYELLTFETCGVIAVSPTDTIDDPSYSDKEEI